MEAVCVDVVPHDFEHNYSCITQGLKLFTTSIPNYCADLGNGPNYRFLLDFTATEEVPSLGYLFLRAVNIFYALPLPDPLVFLGVRYRKTILAVGGHHQPHNSSSSVL